jgi:hypothetical protein
MDNFLSINNSNFDNLILLRHPLWTCHIKVRGIGPGENHRHAGSHWQTLSHYDVWCIEYTSAWAGLDPTTLVPIGTDCIGSSKSNYHTTTTTPTLPVNSQNFLVVYCLNNNYIFLY